MSRNGFKSLTIPEGLYKELEKYVEQSKGYYVSISEVVREAIRDYLANKVS
jgi:Arc/MetJ-type ribon-helix-helix transcriptional regulator